MEGNVDASRYGFVKNYGITTDSPHSKPQNYEDPLNSSMLSNGEVLHMRPSNNFEDITEEQFNMREKNKAEYRKELQRQMEEAN